MDVRIRKVGNSLAITLPSQIAHFLSWQEGDRAELVHHREGLLVRSLRQAAPAEEAIHSLEQRLTRIERIAEDAISELQRLGGNQAAATYRLRMIGSSE